MKLKTPFLLIAITTLAIGCGGSKDDYNIQSLTRSEDAIVEAELEYFDLLYVPMSGLILESIESKLFDTDGTEGSAAFLVEMQSNRLNLWDMYYDGMFFSADNPDTVCFFDNNYERMEIIAIDDGQFADGEIPLCLAHEGQHAIGDSHDEDLTTWIDSNSNNLDDPDFFEQVQNYQDVPYMVDIFFTISHGLYNEYLEQMVTCDTASTSSALDIENFIPTSCEEWIEEARDNLTNGPNQHGGNLEWNDVFDELGLSDTEITTWIEDWGLCEDLIDYCESL
jgi:hypothetical protein